jgi:ribonucleoside-diphosphate reductase alpha chain
MSDNSYNINIDHLKTDISQHIWDSKYRYRTGDIIHDQTIEDTWYRIAQALSSAEPKNKEKWEEQFYHTLFGFKFLPGGRIHAGAGTKHRVTLFNCFVMGIIEDSMNGIFDALKEGALTMQQGGGVGYDFSTLRPAGTIAKTTGTIASGPVSFMKIWDSMCATLLSTGVRRGAMMATLRCDHPDIMDFIEAKKDPHILRNFNLSVQITDEFMQAVNNDDEWRLVFPAGKLDHAGSYNKAETVIRRWSGESKHQPCLVLGHIKARKLWNMIMEATYHYAEPGVLFLDHINRLNNLFYREYITTTNPCGEIPLPPYGACDLGSINLTAFVAQPFTDNAHIQFDKIEQTTGTAVRMLDNVIDISHFPLQVQEDQAKGARRIGIGITGLADTLIMLGLHYGSRQARDVAVEIMKSITHTAYRTSIELAKEKGCFPYFKKSEFLNGKFIQSLPDEIQSKIAKHGIRNSHLISIAPTGTISLLANNISSGIEPVFNFKYKRKVLEMDGAYSIYTITDYAYQQWIDLHNNQHANLPDFFVTATGLNPKEHLEMQAALQDYVDNAISKTINIPESYPLESFRSIYDMAYDKGLKGCTTFRPNPVTSAVLTPEEDEQKGEHIITGADASHCCSIEREAD